MPRKHVSVTCLFFNAHGFNSIEVKRWYLWSHFGSTPFLRYGWSFVTCRFYDPNYRFWFWSVVVGLVVAVVIAVVLKDMSPRIDFIGIAFVYLSASQKGVSEFLCSTSGFVILHNISRLCLKTCARDLTVYIRCRFISHV